MAESSREEIAKLEALYAGNPGGRVFVHLAEAYRKAGEHERARRILDEGLGRHVDSASGHVVLGRVLADMQLTGEAEVAFRRVLELDGGNLVALRWLGDLARQSGRNAEAAAHYRDLLIRNPSNEEVRDLVEIVEREAVSPAPRALDTDEEFPDESADWSADADDTALSGPISDAEERAVGGPASVGGTDPDVTSWSAAPGQAGDTPEAEVEFGLVEIEGLPAEAGETRQHMTSSSVPEREDESEFVASLDDDNAELLELDELRRDDEAEPMEIHLLDPSYEPSDADAEEYVGELDLSDLEAAASFEDDVEYADDSFISDLSAVIEEEPPVDELSSGVDLTRDGSALTLLPDDGEAAPGEAGPAAPSIEEEVSVPSWGDSRDKAAGLAAEYAHEAADEAAADEIAGDISDSAAGVADAGTVIEFHAGTEGVTADFDTAAAGGDGELEDDGEAVEAEAEVPGPVTLGELSGAAERATEAAPAAADEPVVERDIGLVTETMAVLYRSQGFHERAADVYRALLRARPGDERLAARLREAEEASRPAAAPAAGEGEDAGEDAGEVWLRGVATAWSAAKDAGANATPYAWTADAEDVDEAEAGEPIGSYLNDLVTWKSGSRRWMEQQSEPVPDTADAGGEIDLPDWLNDPAGAEPWTPDSPAAGGGAVPAADAGWSPAESVEESDPWAVSDEPASDPAPWAVPDEPSSEVDAWAPAEPVAETDPWEVPGGPVDDASVLDSQMEARSYADQPDGAAPEAPSGSVTPSVPNAPEESGAGWTPLDLDRDVPGDAAPVEPLSTLPGQAGSEEDSGEDEDLEMFRSWLQSLKK